MMPRRSREAAEIPWYPGRSCTLWPSARTSHWNEHPNTPIDEPADTRCLRRSGIPEASGMMSAVARKVLTKRQAEQVVAGYVAGGTIEELAARFGCSTPPVRQALLDAGVPLRPTGRKWPFDKMTERRIALLYEAGATLDELQAEFGSTPRTIRKALTKQGLAIRPTGRRPGSGSSTRR